MKLNIFSLSMTGRWTVIIVEGLLSKIYNFLGPMSARSRRVMR